MDLDQLIREVNRITGSRLERSDPILAASVINEVLLDQALTKLDRQMKEHADRVTAASAQIVTGARAAADALVNESGAWAETRIKTAGEAAAASVLAVLRQETDRAERASRMVTRAMWLTGIIAAIALSGVGGMLLATFR